MTSDSLATSSRHNLIEKITSLTSSAEDVVTAIPGVTLFRRPMPLPPIAVVYEPSLAIIAQGGKRTIVGNETYIHDKDHFLLTSIDLPTIAEVIEASEAAPYLSMLIRLDLDMVRDLMTEVDLVDADLAPSGTGLAIGPTTEPIFADALRLLELHEAPKDIPVLGKIILRGLVYRVLISPAGARLRQIVDTTTQSHRVAKAVGWLRENYLQPLKIDDLAAVANVGASTLHRHFRALTAMSPLQYQKQLRLHEARRLMMSDCIDAQAAALRVGYESTTQFNREYRRQFGSPPVTDIKSLKSGDSERPSVQTVADFSNA